MNEFRTPLSRARGLGAAHHGAGHWISERIGAIALVPLVLWVVYAALHVAPMSRDAAILWLRQPLNAVLMSLLVVTSFQHMQSGLRVVIEDYFETIGLRSLLLLINLFVCVLAGGLALFSVLRIALGGAL